MVERQGTSGAVRPKSDARKERSSNKIGRRPAVVRSLPEPHRLPTSSPQPDAFNTPSFARRSVDITAFGAQGDETDCGGAIADAIEAVHRQGGGTVRIPRGEWLSGQIHLKSNVRLHLDAGAILRFSDDPRKYLPPVFVRAFGQECFNYSPLIYAHRCSNIGLVGEGVIEGRGERWWSLVKPETRAVTKLYNQVLAGVAPEQRRFGTDADPIRPPLIGLIHCSDVLIEGLTIREGGPLWTIQIAYCERATLRKLDIDTSAGPNNDCIVIDSSSEVLVEDCDLRSADDCVSIKSGLNEDGWRVGRPSEQITIQRVRAHAGRGGVTLGSEMSGGIRGVTVRDIQIHGTEFGIRIKGARGRGGVIEHIHFERIEMEQIRGDAIHLTTDDTAYLSPDGRTPSIRNIVLESVRCLNARRAVQLVGLPDRCIEGVLLRDVDLTAEQGLQCFSVQGIHLHNARFNPALGPSIALRDTRGVFIDGLHLPPADRVFLDLRGRLTRDVRITPHPENAARPVIVLGVDVPRDTVFLD